jgi:protein-disulfide isomerase
MPEEQLQKSVFYISVVLLCILITISTQRHSHLKIASLLPSATMLFSSLAVVAAASAALASPVKPSGKTVTLPVKRVSNVKSAKNLVQKERARLNKINGVKSVNVDAVSGPVTNELITYVAEVTIGGSTYDLIVDTGCKLTLGRNKTNNDLIY